MLSPPAGLPFLASWAPFFGLLSTGSGNTRVGVCLVPRCQVESVVLLGDRPMALSGCLIDVQRFLRLSVRAGWAGGSTRNPFC